MQAEIIAFQKEAAQIKDKTGETKVIPIAVITLRSDVPDVLPVGKIVELSVVKDQPQKEETIEELPEEPMEEIKQVVKRRRGRPSYRKEETIEELPEEPEDD